LLYYEINLQHEFEGVFDDSLQGLDPFATDSAVDGLVVEGGGDVDDVVEGDAGLGLWVLDGASLDGADGKDGALWWVDDGGELGDGVVHAHVGDGDGAALVLLWGELAVSGALAEGLGFVRDLGEALGVGVSEHRRDEAGWRGNGDRHVNALVLADDALLFQPGRVDLWDGLVGERDGLDEDVVDGDLVLVLGHRVQRRAQLHELADRHGRRHDVVWVGLLGLRQALGDGLSHRRDWDVLVCGGGGGSWGWGSRTWSGGCGGRGRLVVLDVALDDAAVGAGALDVLERDALLEGDHLGDWGREDSVADSGLSGLGWLLSWLRGSWLGLLLLGLLLLLGWLLLLGGGRALHGLGVVEGEALEAADLLGILNIDGNWLADRHVLGASLHEDLGQIALLLEFEVHGGLVGLNLSNGLTRTELVTNGLVPRTNVTLGHGRRQGRHVNHRMWWKVLRRIKSCNLSTTKSTSTSKISISFAS
jgi:hypothetical protein